MVHDEDLARASAELEIAPRALRRIKPPIGL
jgi:hypothetical protein